MRGGKPGWPLKQRAILRALAIFKEILINVPGPAGFSI
jgi:hypothetical protein